MQVFQLQKSCRGWFFVGGVRYTPNKTNMAGPRKIDGGWKMSFLFKGVDVQVPC